MSHVVTTCLKCGDQQITKTMEESKALRHKCRVDNETIQAIRLRRAMDDIEVIVKGRGKLCLKPDRIRKILWKQLGI